MIIMYIFSLFFIGIFLGMGLGLIVHWKKDKVFTTFMLFMWVMLFNELI